MKTKLLSLLVLVLSLCAAYGASDTIIGPKYGLPNGLYSVKVTPVDSTGAVITGGGGGGGGAVTIADGADTAEGAVADSAVAAGAVGTVSAKLRRLTNDLGTVVTNTAANIGRNVSQINGVTPLMGNGVTGTGSLRVTVASDNTPFNIGIGQGTALGTIFGPMVQGSVTTAAPAYTTGQISPLSLSTAGSLRIDIASANSAAINVGTGNQGTGTLRVVLANDSPTVNVIGSAVNTRGVYNTGIATTANPANATAGNSVGQMMDKAGRTVITPSQVRELVGIQQTNIATTSETTFITAAGASTFADLTDLIITTAGAAAQTITIKDVTGGTTRFVINYPNAAIAPGQPLVMHFSPPIPQATANSAWTITDSAATAINVTAVYIKNL